MAAYYTYRNLNRGMAFSVKHRGLVNLRVPRFAVVGFGHFKVSESGRLRVLMEGKRHVHAFFVSSNRPVVVENREELPASHRLMQVKYSPFRDRSFVDTNGNEVVWAEKVYLIDGRCYIDL